MSFVGFSETASYWITLAILCVFIVIMSVLLQRAAHIPTCTLERRMSSLQSIYALIFFIALLIILFSLIYPILTAGYFGGGSDRDEALNIAVNALLKGEYPYYEVTYVPGPPHNQGFDGNPISPLPGELFLSIPFVIIGNGAYQIFLWILVTFTTITPFLKSRQKALVYILTLFLLLPNVLHETFSGGDLLVNSLWLFCGALITQCAKPGWQLTGISIFMGLAFSTRFNFLLIAPFVAGMMHQKHGLKITLRFCLLIAVIFLIATVPFYLFDPHQFSPLHAYSKIGKFDGLIPHGGLLVPMIAGILAILLMFKLQGQSYSRWFISIAVIMSLPVIYGTVMQSLAFGRIDFVEFSWYGISWIPFSLLSIFLIAQERSVALRNSFHPSSI